MERKSKFNLDLEWTRITDNDLMWVEAKTGLQNGYVGIE